MKNLRQFFIAALCMFMIACNEENPKTLKGSSDGGGGTIAGSTPDQIREAVGYARTALTRNNALAILAGFADDDAQVNSSEAVDALTNIFIPFIRAQKILDEKLKQYGLDDVNKNLTDEEYDLYQELIDESLKTPATLANYIDTVPVEFIDNAPCPASDTDDADASVSEFTLKGKMCFSLKTLQRIPADTIRQHVAGLFVHELAHMSGYSEDVAVATEKVTNLAFSELIAGTKTGITQHLDYSLTSTVNHLSSAKTLQQIAVKMASLSPEELVPYKTYGNTNQLYRVYETLGIAYSSLDHFIYSFAEENSVNQIYFAPEVEDKRLKVIENAKDVLGHIGVALNLKPEDMLKPDVEGKIDQLLIDIDVVKKGFDEIRPAYEPQIIFIKP